MAQWVLFSRLVSLPYLQWQSVGDICAQLRVSDGSAQDYVRPAVGNLFFTPLFVVVHCHSCDKIIEVLPETNSVRRKRFRLVV